MSFYHHTIKMSTSKSYCAEQKTGIKECVILDNVLSTKIIPEPRSSRNRTQTFMLLVFKYKDFLRMNKYKNNLEKIVSAQTVCQHSVFLSYIL